MISTSSTTQRTSACHFIYHIVYRCSPRHPPHSVPVLATSYLSEPVFRSTIRGPSGDWLEVSEKCGRADPGRTLVGPWSAAYWEATSEEDYRYITDLHKIRVHYLRTWQALTSQFSRVPQMAVANS